MSEGGDGRTSRSATTGGEALNPPTLPSSTDTSSTEDVCRRSLARNARMCKELLRSRLQQIEVMEEKLGKLSKYSIKLLDAQEELSLILAREKEDAIRLAAAAWASAHNVGYVMSYGVVLEECCNILLENH